MLMRTAISLTPAGRDCGQTAEAEDLVQETLLKAFHAIDQLVPGTNPRAWLLTVLRRTWIDRWRTRQRRPDAQAVDLDHVAEPAARRMSETDPVGVHDGEWTDPEAVMSRFADQTILNALRLLPEGYRWALLLVDVQSLTIEEAAEALDIAPGTIKSRLHRGRAMLRDRLHDYATEHGWNNDRPEVRACEVKHHD